MQQLQNDFSYLSNKHLIQLVRNFYQEKHENQIRRDLLGKLRTTAGVRQSITNAYNKYILRQILDGWQGEILINNLRYVSTIMEENNNSLQLVEVAGYEVVTNFNYPN